MRKLIFTLLIMFTSFLVQGQTCHWSENFDGTVNMISNGSPGWTTDANLSVSSPNSYNGKFDLLGSSLTSAPIDFTGLTFVILEFDQICKIELVDTARIEIQIGAGPWTKVEPSNGGFYMGSSTTFQNGFKFSEIGYPNWDAGGTLTPDNSWWHHEKFDISSMVGGQANVRIRFVLTDGGNLPPVPPAPAINGRYGWNLDNICVVASPCELNPNTFSFAGYDYYQGNIYFTPPSWDVLVDLNDSIGSGVVMSDLYWTVSSEPPGTINSSPMFQLVTPNPWGGQIFSQINVGDTVCWWIQSQDSCGNVAHWPDTGCVQFIYKGSITYPYCDDFEMGNPEFVDSTAASNPDKWIKGNPSPLGIAANSPTHAWYIGPYGPTADAYLLSPHFDFQGITAANIVFWQWFDAEFGWDGTRLDYSISGGSWNVLGSGSTANPDPNGTNWYTDDQLNQTLEPAWTGVSNGWIESKYKLKFANPAMLGSNDVQFRFHFHSDGSFQDVGYAIDNFCITIPDTIDGGVSKILSPTCGIGMPAGDSISITAQIENFGLNALSGFDVYYRIDQGPIVATPYTGSLASDTKAPLVLAKSQVPSGAFTVCVWTDYPGDNNALNDTVCCNFSGVPTLNPTYCDDFESGNIGWYTLNAPTAPTTTNWELGTPTFPPTNSVHSGTTAWDINLATAYDLNAECYLYTPFFDCSTLQSGNLEFWINVETDLGDDGMRLEYTLNNGLSWITLGNGPATTTPFPAPPGTDPGGTNWYNSNNLFGSNKAGWCGSTNGFVKATYKLCNANGIFGNSLPVQFRFAFDSDGFSNLAGVTLDDFCFYSGSGDDVGISEIVRPSGGVPSGIVSDSLEVIIENFGSTVVTSSPVSYQIGNLPIVTFTWNGTLLPCTRQVIKLPPGIFANGDNNLVVWTSLGTDINNNNDTTRSVVVGQPTIHPTFLNNFLDDCENGNQGYATTAAFGSGNNKWELGYPNFQATTGAYSPNNAWDVNLNTAVSNNSTVYLTTPYFDLTDADNARFRFMQNRNITGTGDEFYIEWDTSGLGQWQRLGINNPSGLTNWYNGTGFWEDRTAGWTFSEFRNFISETGKSKHCQFRFVLETAFTQARDGISIDNFEIFVPIPLSVTPLSVNTSIANQLIFPGQSFTFAAPVKNNSMSPVFNHNITLTIDQQVISTQFVSYTPLGLAPDSVRITTFPTGWIATPGFHTVCVYTDSPNASLDMTQYDDTVCTTINVFDSVNTNQLPYCNSFEAGNRWVTVNAYNYERDTTWEDGVPTQVFINSAHSGNNVFTTYLDNDYANTDSAGLFSSLFRIQRSHCYKIKFFQKFRMEYGSDGGAVDWSADYGNTWNLIDFSGTPNVITMGPYANFTYVPILEPNDPSARAFTGYQHEWMATEKVLRPDADGHLIIRFRFLSDYSYRDEGWAIDDFCFEDLGLCTPLGVTDIITGDFGISQNYPNPANDLTSFEYLLPEHGQVLLTISNLMGQTIDVIENQSKGAGTHRVDYNTGKLAPGMYLYTLQFNDRQVTKRMIITH